jgi:hypothetical protein
MFDTRGQPTTRKPTTRPAGAGPTGSTHLALALLAALLATLVGAAPAPAQAAATLELAPAKALTEVNKPVLYTAHLVDANGREDVTDKTTLDFGGPSACKQGDTNRRQVNCSDNGLYTFTGTYGSLRSNKVELEVVNQRVDPAFGPAPAPSPPHREVTVTGHTGSCSQTGTLRSRELGVNQQVTGIFTVKIAIPPGTFPDTYTLSLAAACQQRQPGAAVGIAVSNQPPDAVNDAESAAPGTSVRIPVTRNDTDPDGDDGYKTALEVDPPTVGTATVLDNQTIQYTPGPGFVDGDQFGYRNCDLIDASGRKRDCGTAIVTVTKPDPVPVPDPDAVTKQETLVSILVTKNDTSPDPKRLRVWRDPRHGTAVVKQPRDGNIDYTPEDGFTGEDSFEYDYCEGVVVGPTVAADACPRATVTVHVEPPDPKAVDDPDVRTERDQPVDIDVMENDEHPVAARLQVLPQPAPQGTPVVQRDGIVRYTPKPGATGKDSFAYDYCKSVINLTAGGACDPATVTVDVRPPPDIRTVTPNPTPPNTKVVVTGSTGSCQDGTLTLAIPSGKDVEVAVTADQDGRFTAELEVPGGTFVGDYTLKLRIDCDGPTRGAQATLEVRNQPPDAVDDQKETTEGTSVTIDVTENDTDPDGDDGYQTSLEATQPANGATRVLSGDEIRYTPDEVFGGGEDPFAYTLCETVDANGKRDCDTATVRVDVERQQILPKITAVTPNPTPPNREVVVTGTTGSCSQAGRLVLDLPSPGKDVEVAVTGAQDGAFEQRLPVPGGTFVGTHPLELRVDCRGALQSAEEQLEVANQAPEAADDQAPTPEGTPVTIDVTGNDTDPDGDDGYQTTLEVGRPANGTAERQGERVRYTPEDGFTGEDRFDYRLCDVVDAGGDTDCGSATVTVTVTDTSGPVIASVQPGSTPPGRAVEVAGNTGACGRAGTLALQGTGATTTVTGDQDGAFTASLTVPPGTLPRPYRLELRVDCQGQPQRAEAELTVTNQAPEAADDAQSTTRDQAVRIPVADNDRDPDDPDGYRTRVLVTDPPDRGTVQEQPDLSVIYTPAPGVIGEDQFTYSLCDDVLDAAGRANCGAATVTVIVTDVPVISSVEPAATSPGRPVKVVGNTGSCDRAGTLTFRGEADLRMDVTGDRSGGFTADFTVPERTFPGARRLELVVDCGGQLQRAEAELTVVNQAPVAADDQARITPDASTAIDVTRNDRDPDDPDTYPTLLLVTDPPDHGTAEVRSDLSVVYTPEPGFTGEDRFVYSLCDDLLNPAGRPDCGEATVTVTVDPTACAPAAGQDPGLRVNPDRGRGGTRLHITAAVDPRLATCQFRLLLGGTPLGPAVSVGDDGSISADRGVPSDAKPGPSPVRLATLSAETVDEIPFEVTGGSPPPWWPPWLPRLLLSAGLLVAGFLARAVYKKLSKPDQRPTERRVADLPDDLRAEPHTRPVEAAVEPVNDNTRTLAVRLEPHPDTGVQIVETLEEVPR